MYAKSTLNDEGRTTEIKKKTLKLKKSTKQEENCLVLSKKVWYKVGKCVHRMYIS